MLYGMFCGCEGAARLVLGKTRYTRMGACKTALGEEGGFGVCNPFGGFAHREAQVESKRGLGDLGDG